MIRDRARQTICLVAAIFLLAATTIPSASASAPVQPLVSAEWLEFHLGQKGLIVVDIRPKQDFEAGHIPGAVNGEYPEFWRRADWALLPPETLGGNLSALGVDDHVTVVIVPSGGDATELGGATFAYWVLKYLGHEDAAILDGGWMAWHSEPARSVQSGPSTPTPASFTAHLHPEIRATTEAVTKLLRTDTVFVDGRSLEQYLGKAKSGLVSRAGRLPGAINLPFSALYDDAAHRLKPASELASLVPPELINSETQVITYCNTGHWSSIDWFVLHELLGYAKTRLYDGSMAVWTRDPKRPVETGEPRAH